MLPARRVPEFLRVAAADTRALTTPLTVAWVRRGGWLAAQLTEPQLRVPRPPRWPLIVASSARTALLDAQPLWEGYGELGGLREPQAVATSAAVGSLYSWLTQLRQPRTIVEFGTAFGASGMYFLAGLERNRSGRLYTFEPNAIWRDLAQRNLARVGRRFESVAGTFEDNLDVLGDLPIDLALIDAIHRSEFVDAQLELIAARLAPDGLVLLDDINFSADMEACWARVAAARRVAASCAIGARLGVLELS